MKISLNRDWSVGIAGENERMTADIPASQYTVLKRHGRIPDPFFGLNEGECLWPAEKDFVFSKEFDLDESALSHPHMELCCQRIDTLAEISINGNEAGSCFNAHIALRLDIKKYLRAGKNKIEILFRSPVVYIREKQKDARMPFNNNGLNGMQLIRKPACHFGWDWGPILPCSGIMDDIYLDVYSAKLARVDVGQVHRDGNVMLEIEPEIYGEAGKDATVRVELLSPDGEVIANSAAAPEEKTVIEVKNPRLWKIRELLKPDENPALYTLKATLFDGKEQSEIVRRVGLRTIELDRAPDARGRQFAFKLNGVRIFAKGANWIPPDTFPDDSGSKSVRLLRDCAEANMNMIRVWGGGYYETDRFYDLCDELGLLVWQDFCFACAPYPFYDKDFLSNVKNEIFENVKRIKGHACLALWCGNNELEAMTAGWRYKTKLVKWTRIFFYDILPRWVGEADKDTPFINGSPCGDGWMKGVGSDDCGDTHLWQVWHGLRPLDYYSGRKPRFCSEFGLESLPDPATVRAFTGTDQNSLDTPVFTAHQKCASGNNKMLFYASTIFRLPQNFDDLVYLTQLSQAICVEAATMHWRRNKGECNGSLYWQLNDCWPAISWSGIDYFGRYKALQYAAKRFFAPVAVSAQRKKNKVALFIINDSSEDFSGELDVKLYDFAGKVLFKENIPVKAAAGENFFALERDFSVTLKQYGKNVVLRTVLKTDGHAVSEQNILFDAEKNLQLPKSELTVSTELSGDGRLKIDIGASAYARYVKLDAGGAALKFSDNYFDLLAGESRTIYAESINGERISEATTVSAFSLCDIKPRSNRLGDALVRLKIRLIPINIINAIAYRFM